MAEDNPDDRPIEKGSTLPATIEEVLADVLVVCLKHGAKIYKGILLDSTKRDMPYGVGFDRFRMERDKREIAECETAFVDPNTTDNSSLAKDKVGSQPQTKAPSTHAEVTALSCRYTFNQDPNSTDPRLLPPPKRTLVKPIRDGKNVRNMRLRPRKVLCSNCKQGIHENAVKGNTTSEKGKQCENGAKSMAKPVAQPTLKMTLRGKRKATDNSIVPSPKRPKKQYLLAKPRVSPVIKISFTSPQGKVHTSKLMTSTNDDNAQTTDAGAQQIDEEQMEKFDYKKIKKAWRRARIKDKDDSSKGTATPPVSDEESGRHHKKPKRSKHKKKHRHRSLSVCIPQEEKLAATYALNNGGSDFENDASRIYRATVEGKSSEKEIKALDGWDGCEVGDTSHHLDNSPYNKKHSVNIPTQHIQLSRLNQTNEDQANMECSSFDGSGSIESNDPGCISDANIKSDDDMPLVGDQFPTSESEEQQEEARVRPLMMRIQTKNVSTGKLPDGRSIRVGDVVWGKIHGFPWWPGKILCITVSQRDNGTVITQMAQIAWCGSSTMSHMPCSELYPFLEDFKYRYNKKKKGSYKNAIKEATCIAQVMLNADTCASPNKTPVSDRELECESVEVLND